MHEYWSTAEDDFPQPPKSRPSHAQKLEMILDYLRQSATCHTLKELEKELPAAALITSMVVKDMIRELTDENKVKVEKIGSGNWYWSWASDEARERKKTIALLEYSLTPVTPTAIPS